MNSLHYRFHSYCDDDDYHDRQEGFQKFKSRLCSTQNEKTNKTIHSNKTNQNEKKHAENSAEVVTKHKNGTCHDMTRANSFIVSRTMDGKTT